MKKSTPQVFIIESLRIEDEEADLKEGEIISRMLNLAGKTQTAYCYIRTRCELEEFVRVFADSEYRYLHMSCHADKTGIQTTFDCVSNADLGNILRGHLHKKRVFVSACKMARRGLARELFDRTGLLSLVGPRTDIRVDDAAAFWVSFYHLMFKDDPNRMRSKHLRSVLKNLTTLYDLQMNYLGATKDSSPFRCWSY